MVLDINNTTVQIHIRHADKIGEVAKKKGVSKKEWLNVHFDNYFKGYENTNMD